MMIFPDDYKMVGITKGDPYEKALDSEPIYFATKYIIADLTDGSYKIVEVETEQTGSLLAKARSFRQIASGDEIIVHEKEHDAHNRTKLILLALEKYHDKVNTVIFKGRDKHITFVHKPNLLDITDIQIIDVIPPEPPWLSFAIHRLEESGIFGELNIKFERIYIDLREFEGENTVFPCNASGLNGKYLDTDSDINDNSLLIGCDISKEIFDLRFPGFTYKHINMCPLKTELINPTKPFITRCCQTKRTGFININGHDGAVVHWGASEYDIVDAIRRLVNVMNGGEDEDRID